MEIINIKSLLDIIQWHDERYIFYLEMMVFAEDINKSFAHITIDATLDRITQASMGMGPAFL